MNDTGLTTGTASGPEKPRRPGYHATGARSLSDALLRGASAGSGIFVLMMLGALLVVLFVAAAPSIKQFGWKFLVGSDWRPNTLEVPRTDSQGNLIQDPDTGENIVDEIPPAFGALPVIFGTIVSSVLALLVAVPLSLGSAIFLIRMAPRWMAPTVSFMIEFLAAIPSIAYGIWGIFVLSPLLEGELVLWPRLNWLSHVPVIRWMLNESTNSAGQKVVQVGSLERWLNHLFLQTPGLHWLGQTKGAITGRDMLAGGLILAIMIIPIITAISRDVLRQVPRPQVEGTVALGATWWQSCREMLRYGRAGLFGAVMLGLARAAGETMAITMVIGNNSQIKSSLFQAAQTMSSLLANEFSEASTDIHRAALCEVGLILLVMSLVFNVAARYLVVGTQSRTAAAF